MIGIFSLVGPLLGSLGGLAGVASIPYIGPLLSFFGTGVGRLVGVGLIVLGAYAYGHHKGEAYEHRLCEARIITINKNWSDAVAKAAEDFAEERRKRDDDVDATLGSLVEQQTKTIAERAAAAEKKVQEYEADRAKRPSDATCLLSPDDLGLRKR